MDHAKDQARAQLDNIKELVKALNTDDYDQRCEAQTAIAEDPLEVLYRSGWYASGQGPDEPAEALILLCTGGPAVRLIVDLDKEYYSSSRIEYQDWGTEWVKLTPYTREDEEAVEIYCSVLGL